MQEIMCGTKEASTNMFAPFHFYLACLCTWGETSVIQQNYIGTRSGSLWKKLDWMGSYAENVFMLLKAQKVAEGAK